MSRYGTVSELCDHAMASSLSRARQRQIRYKVGRGGKEKEMHPAISEGQ